MNKSLNTTILLDIYGSILTKRQYNILDDYYNKDLSLTEIAENEGITRQAVGDNIKTGEKKLYDIESKLNMMKKSFERQDKVEEILVGLKKIKNKTKDEEINSLIIKIEKELNDLI